MSPIYYIAKSVYVYATLNSQRRSMLHEHDSIIYLQPK